MLGPSHRRFSRYSSKYCLQQLYLSFVRPHLEYAVPVWDPHCLSHVNTLERIQKFFLGMIHRAWKENYNIIFQRSGLLSLSDLCYVISFKLCLCYVIFFKLCMVISAAQILHFNHRLRGPYHLRQPIARMLPYKFSFFPHAISL